MRGRNEGRGLSVPKEGRNEGMVGRRRAGPEGATCSALSLVKERDDKEAPDSDAEGYVEGLDDEEEDEDGTWGVLHGILHPTQPGEQG